MTSEISSDLGSTLIFASNSVGSIFSFLMSDNHFDSSSISFFSSDFTLSDLLLSSFANSNTVSYDLLLSDFLI